MAVPQPASGQCPFFHAAMMPVCAASEGRVRHPSQAESRAYCKSLFHRYCNLYNARLKAAPVPAPAPAAGDGAPASVPGLPTAPGPIPLPVPASAAARSRAAAV